ncbi:hypothetical protein M2475_001621 [Breznakia sp. PF5-3]|uniref:hypothetical protein n=1 Tax=unclassified Breznakia TaxID=2623764 RepID=UPI00240675B4|nr:MULTISPECIES: hypothetical protein [unclassified Breznakia]MDF9825187.1 hypothetical protein [Breznakia sp. PM6-1]MDF9836045.1 hypothetical protein [Breznakia sp. PF5-3]MDF9838594.1 hypothetical protein [Breznakia sp. PFB2-8]MDF9860637.1 hypothetical protein [Breznakia sp. PH5-24]
MANKKPVLIIFVCLFLLAGMGAYFYYDYQKQQSYKAMQITFKKVESVYEAESELDAISFVKNSSNNIVDIAYPTIDTSQVGEHVYIYVAYDDYGNQKEFALVLNFSDPILPVLELTATEVSIEEGTAIDLQSYVKKAEDPIDGKLKVAIKKPKHYDRVGIHEILYSCKDKNGNKVSAILRLIVKEKSRDNEQVKEEENNAQNGGNNDINQNESSSSKPSQPTLPKAESKQFLFTDGYNMVSAQKACRDYLAPYSNGSCRNIYDANGLPIGQEAILY